MAVDSNVNGGSGNDGAANTSSTEQVYDSKNLIVNYLPQTMTDDEFFDVFKPVGRIKSYRVMRNPETGVSCGYGFVQFSNPDDADKAISTLDGTMIQSKKLKVSYARPPGHDVKDTNLYIQGLPRNINEDFLYALFSPFGKIVQHRVLRDKVTQMPRGVGFVRFSRTDEAQTAIKALNGVIPDGGIQALTVRVAEDHTKLKQQYMGIPMASHLAQANMHAGGAGAAGLGGMSAAAAVAAQLTGQYNAASLNSPYATAAYGGAQTQLPAAHLQAAAAAAAAAAGQYNPTASVMAGFGMPVNAASGVGTAASSYYQTPGAVAAGNMLQQQQQLQQQQHAVQVAQAQRAAAAAVAAGGVGAGSVQSNPAAVAAMTGRSGARAANSSRSSYRYNPMAY